MFYMVTSKVKKSIECYRNKNFHLALPHDKGSIRYSEDKLRCVC